MTVVETVSCWNRTASSCSAAPPVLKPRTSWRRSNRPGSSSACAARCRAHGPSHVLDVVLRALGPPVDGPAHVRPVAGGVRRHRDQRVVELDTGEVADAAPALADPHQQLDQPGDVAAQEGAEDLRLCRDRVLVPRALVAGDLLVGLRQPLLSSGIDQERRRQRSVVVPRRSIDGPRRQLLAGREDLLHSEPRPGRQGSEPSAVLGRVGHAVDVIDPQAVDGAVLQQSADDAMGGVEDLGVLCPQGDEGVDVQEAPVVELVGGDLPAREPVGLRGEKGVQSDRVVRQPA